MSRPVWPSKIGTIPGPVVAIKGYGKFRPGGRPPEGSRIEYKEARQRRRRSYISSGTGLEWVADWWQPWHGGIVQRYTESGIMCITKF